MKVGFNVYAHTQDDALSLMCDLPAEYLNSESPAVGRGILFGWVYVYMHNSTAKSEAASSDNVPKSLHGVIHKEFTHNIFIH